MIHPRPHYHLLLAAGVAVCVGCSSDNQVADFARRATLEQADQNRRIADAHNAVAEGSKRLVESDALARRELVSLQQELRRDQAEVGRHRDALESERKALSVERQRDLIVGNAVLVAGVLLACLAPLVLAGMAIWHLRQPPTEEEVTEVLTQELVHILSETPPREALSSRTPAELPAPDRP